MFNKMMKGMKFSVITVLLAMSVISLASAQTDKEVIDSYNKAVQLLNSDTKAAIAAFEKCVSLANEVEELGDKAAESKKLAEDQIPKLYYKLAVQSYKKRDFQGAIDNFRETAKAGKKYGNTALAQKSERLIPKVYYAWGKQEYAKKNYDNALKIFDEGLGVEPNLASAWLGKALVYDKLKQEDKMKEAADKAIEIAGRIHDQKTLTSAQKFMRNYTYNHAVMAIQGNKTDVAMKYLQSSVSYGNNSPDVYYELAKLYNTKGKYNEALNHIRKAISLDHGNEVVKARYYYTLGKIYENMDKKAEACSAFKKALHPPYEESAKYEIDNVLKCGK